MRRKILHIIIGSLSSLLVLSSCKNDHSFSDDSSALFSELKPNHTQVDFLNQLDYTEEFNVYTYKNFYNGGGVGLGDINNDGLIDLFFCGNIVDNKLYLNKGNFQFEDITEKAGVACQNVWSSGVSMADVNGDGLLDIYVCKAGEPGGDNRHNELFINNGDLTFTEKANSYGIANEGLSTHAAFFDMDRDGDLDCYLLNNSMRPVGVYDLRPGQRNIRDTLGGNRLYENVNGKYVDISEKAGIYGSAIGFGLGVTIGDVNKDGWMDIYVSNDFFEKDYLYLNNQDGTFTENLEDQITEISMGSMGADMADINNDALPDIFVTDMLPEDNERMKTKTVFENWDKYQMNLRNGYYRQFTRNVLQLNQGNKPAGAQNETPFFSEIGRLTGVHATDWSWGALISDLDNNGHKDLFVANGIYKDITDLDYVNFYSDASKVRALINSGQKAITTMIDAMPSKRLPNYVFSNEGNLTFKNKTVEWGLATPSHSNGSAYGDLDNDGDMDLVINNVNMPPFIYRNNTNTIYPERHYLKVELKGDKENTFALGAKVSLFAANQIFYQELITARGFESTCDHRLNFGLGNIEKVDRLEVIWPDGTSGSIHNPPVDTTLLIEKTGFGKLTAGVNKPILKTIFSEKEELNKIKHRENDFVDFDRDQLIYHMLSRSGPALAIGDVDENGLEDIFIGSSKNEIAQLYLQVASGEFKRKIIPDFERDKISEETDCIFFDADGDSDLDLYLARGSNEFASSSIALGDRIYFNDGEANFSKAPQTLPPGRLSSSSCVRAADFDQDGDQDLFVGTRLRPFLYGVPVSGYVLENDGNGVYKDVTKATAPELNEIGMITDVRWIDYDGDSDEDLLIIGEWMSLHLFENKDGKLKDISKSKISGLENGFWNCMEAADLDDDGDMDLVLGNHGLNSRFKASREEPIRMYINDFDGNRTAEQVVCVYNNGHSYPLALKHDLVKQLPELKKKYLKYENYKNEKIEDIFSQEQLDKSVKLEASEMRTGIAINEQGKGFRFEALPIEAQFAPIFGIEVADFDKDGKQDILLGGNFFHAKPEVGIYAGSHGLLLKGQGKNQFEALPASQSGIYIKGEVREIETIDIGEIKTVIFSRNNDSLIGFKY